jgi:hypothetical protein
MSEENKQPTHSVKHDTVHQHSIPLLPQNTIDDIIEGTRSSYNDYIDIADSILTDA